MDVFVAVKLSPTALSSGHKWLDTIEQATGGCLDVSDHFQDQSLSNKHMNKG